MYIYIPRKFNTKTFSARTVDKEKLTGKTNFFKKINL